MVIEIRCDRHISEFNNDRGIYNNPFLTAILFLNKNVYINNGDL